MALVTTKEMFKKAYEGGYAIGAFNVNNMEIVQAITEAAWRTEFPDYPAGICRCKKVCKPHIPCKTR
ncbi:MAG: class II fructose-bisphosphate aldolase [Anaerosacchariphilus sp.]